MSWRSNGRGWQTITHKQTQKTTKGTEKKTKDTQKTKGTEKCPKTTRTQNTLGCSQSRRLRALSRGLRVCRGSLRALSARDGSGGNLYVPVVFGSGSFGL